MSDISGITAALEQVMKDHGLPVESVPLRRFTLPLTAWREGII